MKNLNAIKKILLIIFFFGSFEILAQEQNEMLIGNVNSQEETLDTSKPTNFYSFIDNTLEYSSQEKQTVYGYRGKLTLALSESHMLLAEVPIMYNDRTKKLGVGDIRARYFWLPYKNYDRFLGAFGPSVDITAPTGNFNDGLGSGRWVASPGLTVGLIAAEWIQFFPIVSYQFAGKPTFEDLIPKENKETHGLTFQVITPLVFSDKFFMQVTPIYKMNEINDERKDRYEQEVFASYTLSPTMQLTGFYSGAFQDKVHTISAGLSIFF